MPHRTRAAMALLTVVGLTVPMTGLAQAEPSETGSLIIPLTDTDGTAMGTAEAGFDSGEQMANPRSGQMFHLRRRKPSVGTPTGPIRLRLRRMPIAFAAAI